MNTAEAQYLARSEVVVFFFFSLDSAIILGRSADSDWQINQLELDVSYTLHLGFGFAWLHFD